MVYKFKGLNYQTLYKVLLEYWICTLSHAFLLNFASIPISAPAPCESNQYLLVLKQGDELPEGFKLSMGGDINTLHWEKNIIIEVPSMGNIKLANLHFGRKAFLYYLKFDIQNTDNVVLNITKRQSGTDEREILKVRLCQICNLYNSLTHTKTLEISDNLFLNINSKRSKLVS